MFWQPLLWSGAAKFPVKMFFGVSISFFVPDVFLEEEGQHASCRKECRGARKVLPNETSLSKSGWAWIFPG
jgi:hypothetical protein